MYSYFIILSCCIFYGIKRKKLHQAFRLIIIPDYGNFKNRLTQQEAECGGVNGQKELLFQCTAQIYAALDWTA